MPKDLPIKDLSLKIVQGESVEIPTPEMLIDAAYTKNGNDLVLKGEFGTVTVEGYFDGVESPDLAVGNLKITPDMVDSFIKPAHAGEYADASASASMTDVSAIGRITEIVGDVIITRADGTEVIAEVGTVLHQGDVIETGAEGAANILFADNTSFAISEDARMSVDEFSYDAAAQEGSSFFSMLKGAFVYTSGIIGKDDPGNVSIDTPTGSIGIRGTVVMGKIDPVNHQSEITIIDGAVVITNAAGTVELDQTFETVRLSGYEDAPQFMGQMSADYVQSSFESLSTVAGGTFSRAFSGNDNNADGANAEGESDGNAQTAPVDGAPTDVIEAPESINETAPTGSESGSNTNAPITDSPIAHKIANSIKAKAMADAAEAEPTNSGPVPFNFDNSDGVLNVREFEDTGFRIGTVDTVGIGSVGAHYEIIAGSQRGYSAVGGAAGTAVSNVFSIDPATGGIKVEDAFQLNFDQYKAFGFDVRATSTSGEILIRHFVIEVDAIVPTDVVRETGTSGDDSMLHVFNDPDDRIYYTGDGNDTITDNAFQNTYVLSGDGNDIINIGFMSTGASVEGGTTVFAGQGNDIVNHQFFNSGTDELHGGLGIDTLALKRSPDTLMDYDFDLNASTTQNFSSFENILLDGFGTPDQALLRIDTDAITKLTGGKLLVVDNSATTSQSTVELQGDWEQLTAYDGDLFGSINSKVFQNVDTGHLVVTNGQNNINFTENPGGTATAVSVNNDPVDIPELAPLL